MNSKMWWIIGFFAFLFLFGAVLPDKSAAGLLIFASILGLVVALPIMFRKPKPPRTAPLAGPGVELFVIGRNGQLEVKDHSIVLRRQGFVGFMINPTKGDKEIQIRSINAIQLKKPGFSAGYIQFTIAGGIESRGGVSDAVSDENTIIFGDRYDEFARAKEMIEGKIHMLAAPAPAASAASAMDELTKAADLHSRGVLTDQEFAAKKAQLLTP